MKKLIIKILITTMWILFAFLPHLGFDVLSFVYGAKNIYTMCDDDDGFMPVAIWLILSGSLGVIYTFVATIGFVGFIYKKFNKWNTLILSCWLITYIIGSIIYFILDLVLLILIFVLLDDVNECQKDNYELWLVSLIIMCYRFFVIVVINISFIVIRYFDNKKMYR